MRRVALSAERASGRPAAVEVVALGGAAALLVACSLPPDHIEDGPVVCPFRRLTGLPCPGCGLTRSWVYLAHARWADAVAAHPFGALAAVAALVLVVAVVVARARRRPPPDLNRFVRRPWVIGVVSAWLAFAVVRLLLSV